jgi:hypothetical protein
MQAVASRAGVIKPSQSVIGMVRAAMMRHVAHLVSFWARLASGAHRWYFNMMILAEYHGEMRR